MTTKTATHTYITSTGLPIEIAVTYLGNGHWDLDMAQSPELAYVGRHYRGNSLDEVMARYLLALERFNGERGATEATGELITH